MSEISLFQTQNFLMAQYPKIILNITWNQKLIHEMAYAKIHFWNT